ncbi:TetR/AcrR family transcriptional regulator [Rhodobacter sp. SY28-1]|uniref:TetR/AcrR family transcriptional regulator n=1 Tax=Rhodobacter sp. SY28-1 TaxID=2562317 RepID=UPI0019810265|nr:TetR/AcrR family transcriptional regulator [Rhodobacter sp. SY28-1]
MTRVPRGEARARLIEAARSLVRHRGFAATSVDELCAAAGVTKGAFFHHFPSKEALGVALVDDWTAMTGAMFAAHPYNTKADPLDRVFAYIDLRRELLGQPLPEFSCVAGTTVQESYETSPPIRAAAERSIRSGFDHVRRHLEEALAAHPVPGITADSLAQQFQVATQGGIILAKALNDPAPAREAFDHLERYLRLLFGR